MTVRTRVTLAVIAVLTLTLVLVGVVVSALAATQADRNLDTLLAGRLQLARQLARNGSGPQQIVNRVGTAGAQVQVELRTGTVYGYVPTGPDVRSVQSALTGPNRVNGATITIAVDTSLVQQGQQQLRRVLIGTSLAAIALAALLAFVTVRFALRPLDTVAGLARRITAGERGGRLRPRRTDTEIGQTAAALDEMLDELEGAESRARDAEQRTRTFLADAAHELRTPIAGIWAAAETLLHHGHQLDPEQRQQLEVLLIREAGRAGGLVSDLLAAARLDAGVTPQLGPVALGAMAHAEVERARLLVPAATVRQWGDDPVVQGDRDQLAGVVRNLVDNAVRAAGPTGTIEVRTFTDSGWAYVEVLDSGPGVPPADRERVFDRMVRLDAGRAVDGGGSGLGLAIARGYARAHGGDLTCLEGDSTGELTGARFRLALRC